MVILTTNLPNEVHDKDFHYSRLMVRFIRDDNNNTLPISIYNPNLESLLFSHLFPNGKGHFHDIRENARLNEDKLKTLKKYTKHMILFNDYRFRTDHYWPSHTYL